MHKARVRANNYYWNKLFRKLELEGKRDDFENKNIVFQLKLLKDMLQYLVILLDDTSVSFCHYSNPIKERRLMPLDILKKGILWAMKENLMIQFVFPDYTLPNKYLDVIETIDHSKIKPVEQYSNADVIVVQSWEDLDKISFKDISVVLRTTRMICLEIMNE